MTYMEVTEFLADPRLYKVKGRYHVSWVVSGLVAMCELEYIAY